MPTPVGHALGGLATAWFAQALAGTPTPKPANRSESVLAVACVAAAIAPDIDILVHSHRTYTHSAGAVMLVAALVWFAVRARARLRHEPSRPAWFLAVTIAAAYGSHILLDLLGKDTAPPSGLTALWPFSSRYYISGFDLFMEISRRYWKWDEFVLGNAKAGAWELLVLGPVVVLAWKLRQSRGRARA